MAKFVRKVTPPMRTKKRRVRSRAKRSKRASNPMTMGMGYSPSSNHSVVTKEKKKTFTDRISDYLYPPYTSKVTIGGGYDTTSPSAYSQAGSNSQHINLLRCFDLSDLITLASKARDAYFTSTNAGDTSIPTIADANQWKNQNYSHKLKYLHWKLTMVNTCSATTEYEVLWITPRRFIHDSESTNITDPAAYWQLCNNHAQLAVNANPSLTGATVALPAHHLGDRPYKNATRTEYNRYYNILAKDKFVLEPGISKKLSFSFAQNKTFIWEDIIKNDSLPYLTLSCIIISKGQVNNGNAVGFGDVNHSDHQYSWISDRTATLSIRSFKRKVVWRDVINLGTTIPSAQNFYNDDTKTMVGYTEGV